MQEELLNIAREKASKQICLSLLEEGVVHDLQDIAAEVLEEEKAERDAKLQELASIVIRRRIARYFKRYGISDSPTSSLVFLKRVDTTLFSMIRLGVLQKSGHNSFFDDSTWFSSKEWTELFFR